MSICAPGRNGGSSQPSGSTSENTLMPTPPSSIPCKHIEEITGKAIFDPLINRSGLNCKILQGGTVRVGDTVRND